METTTTFVLGFLSGTILIGIVYAIGNALRANRNLKTNTEEIQWIKEKLLDRQRDTDQRFEHRDRQRAEEGRELQRQLEDMRSSWFNSLNSTEDVLRRADDELHRRIDDALDRLRKEDEEIEERIDDVQSELERQIIHVESEMERRISGIEDDLTDRIDNVEERLEDRVEDNFHAAMDRSNEISRYIDSRIDKTVDVLCNRMDTMFVQKPTDTTPLKSETTAWKYPKGDTVSPASTTEAPDRIYS